MLEMINGVKEYEGVQVVIGPECHDGGSKGYGSTKSGVMFIGISPNREESRAGRPLVGQQGRLLDAVLKSLSQSRKDIYCTNLICCWKDELSREAADACYRRLETEIKLVKPRLIVLLGGFVSEYITDRKFGKIRGAVQWDDRFDCYVLSTYHPNGILQSMGQSGAGKDDKASLMIYDFVRDIKKIPDVVTWEPGAPQAQVKYEVVTKTKDAQSILDNLYFLYGGIDEPIALDVETTYAKDDEEVDADQVDVLCVGIGTKDFAWVFTPEALYREDGSPALDWPTGLWWTMQNAIFDTHVMKTKLGVWIEVKEDTMLQSYSLDERSGIHKLKTQAREYLAAGFYEDDRFYGKLKLDEIPREILYEYNARDVCYTARLCVKYRPWQIADNVRGFYERILIPSVNMYKQIQYRGVNIDRALHSKFGILWGHRYLNDEEELMDIAEQEGFDGRINLRSPAQLAKLLYKHLSLPIIKLTKGGNPSTDQKTLEKFKGQHPFVDKLMDFRHLSHMYDLYILGMMQQLKADGRAHAIVKLHGSRTGRPSYTNPPLQTIPTPYNYEDDFGMLRQLFIPSSIEWVREFNKKNGLPLPPDEDTEMVIIEADYGKAEIWMAYTESRDPQLLADLTSGDYHANVASDIMDKPIEEVTKADRTTAKRTTFGIMYWVEKNSLGELIKTSSITAQIYIDKWFNRNKKYAEWFKNVERVIRQTGELVTKTGRKRRLIILGSAVRVLKQAVNFPIQSTANDVLQEAALEIHPKLIELGGHILFTVHDSILSEVPRSKVPEAVQIIHDAMIKQRYPDIVQIPVEIKVGYNWGQGFDVHDCAKSARKQPDNDFGVPKFGACLWEIPA